MRNLLIFICAVNAITALVYASNKQYARAAFHISVAVLLLTHATYIEVLERNDK